MAVLTFEEEGIKRLVAAVRRVEAAEFLGDRHPPRRGFSSRPLMFEGVLDGDLAAPATPALATTATLSVHRTTTAGGFVDSLEDIITTNRDPKLSARTGDWLAVERIGGEWRPVGGGEDAAARRVFTVQAPFTVPPGKDALVRVDTSALGVNITVTLPVGAGVQIGMEVIVLNYVDGVGTANALVVAFDTLGVPETKTLTPGDAARAIGTKDLVTGPPVVDTWYWVNPSTP